MITPTDYVIINLKMVNFKKTIHIKRKTIWSQITIHGCRFHLSQSWYRIIQKNGLSIEYKNKKSDNRKGLVKCYGLPFLD